MAIRTGSAAAPAAVLLLAGCFQGLDVGVVQQGNQVEFVFSKTSGSGPACVSTVTVTPMQPDNAKPVWQVDAAANACLSRLAYGGTSGVAPAPVPPPLTPGVRYKVVARGSGYFGGQQFVYGKG